jgi:hypothetical protein
VNVSTESGQSRPEPAPACGLCRYFNAAPADLEQAIPGLVTMGSGYSSVRDEDGICGLHDRYLGRTNHCAAFAAR